ncbi:MAG: FtsW/RodA/SpoVE family cell cycle protein [Chloroflexota bacterium]|nr:FtsW/RodA/SpoVE family cell cycle protein [Chloroflexota bacterium]
MTRTNSMWRNFDWLMLLLAVALTVFGVLMIRSATLGAIDPELINRVPNQIRYAILSFLVLFGFAALDYRILSGVTPWLYGIMVLLLVAVFFFGVEGDGGLTRGWLNVGIPIQPSEIAKLLIVVTLAQFLARNYERIGDLRVLGQAALHIGIPAGLIFIQPDLGITAVFVVIWLVMLWGSGLKVRHIVIFGIAFTLMLPFIWTQMERYQQERIISFVLPQADPDAYYNILQANISIGSGGLLGKGYAQGPQNVGRFLRVRHTDFIYSVIAEEFGFVGAMAVMVLIGVVILRVLRGARMAADPFGALICYGVAAFLFFQTFVSIGMNLSLMPVTGLTLPFISSGGTSLLSTLAGIGLAESVIMRGKL